MATNHLNVTRLRVIHELARRGSVAAVADALWMTPSAVSQHLSTLERETEVKLVERAGRGLRLTPAGELLAEHGGRVMAALDEARVALQGIETRPSGGLRIASFPSAVGSLVAPAVATLTQRFPELVVEVEDLEGEQGVEAVRGGRVDVAIIDESGWDAGVSRDGIEVVELFEDRLVVVLPVGHALAAGESVPWSALDGEPLIVEQRTSLFSGTVASACRRAGFEPVVRGRLHDVTAMLSLVRMGGYLCVLPELALSGQGEGVTWRPLEPVVLRRLMVAARAGRLELPAIRALVEALAR